MAAMCCALPPPFALQIWNQHDLSVWQWLAVAAVFIGLLGAIASEQRRRAEKLRQIAELGSSTGKGPKAA